jgi:hypothetical protein
MVLTRDRMRWGQNVEALIGSLSLSYSHSVEWTASTDTLAWMNVADEISPS